MQQFVHEAAHARAGGSYGAQVLLPLLVELPAVPSFVCPTGCQHSIVLTDPGYGDGWNGNTVSVLVNGVVVLNNVTLPSGYGPITYYFLADTGDAITTVYTGTAWPSENCYQLYDGANNLLCEQPPGCTYTPPGNCAVIGFCP